MTRPLLLDSRPAALLLMLLLAVPHLGGEAMAEPAEPAPAISPLDDFEDAGRSSAWSFHNGPEFPGAKGSFERTARAAHAGKMGGALAFDFSGGGNYVQATFPLPEGAQASHVRLWMRKACANRVTIRCTDSEGQTFQKGFSYAYAGWQEVLVSLSGWTGSWGGENDGVFRGAPRSLGILVENTAPAKKGEVHFDDLRLVAGSPAGHPEVTYTAADFGLDEPWRLSAGGDAGESRREGSVLRYDFRKGAARVGLASDFSLMGRPQSLALHVHCSGLGHAVRVRIGSHFQSFEKVIGVLDRPGDHVFEVPLGDMHEWTHGGGENDGVARMPLRVLYVGLERGGTRDTGAVQLISMKVTTRVAPEQAVVLVPDGRARDGAGRFTCEVRSLLAERVAGELLWEFRDFAGATLSRGSRAVSLAAGATRRFATSHPLGGRPFLECVFRFRAAGRAFGPAAATATAPLTDLGSAALDPRSPFGMGLYLYRYPGTPAGFDLMNRAAAMAQTAGVKWSREEFLWHRIEPEKGRFDWAYYDAMVETAQRHGISIYGLIDYWSGWTKPYTPEGIEDYARYCKALVSHYKDRIKHWEVWNEPNIFFWSGPREMYADLLKTAYRAIKEADPEAQVLGCSTAGIDRRFIEQVMDAGAPFDVLTIHPYRGRLDDEGFIRELQETADLTAKGGGARRPVWITEMGWPTQAGGGVGEREQAGLLARSYLCAVASGAAPNVSWYDFREDGENPFYNEHHFGVVRARDLSPKPGYRALATVCRTLAGQSVRGRLDVGPGVLAYRFAGGGRETVAIWSPAADRVLELRIGAPAPKALDLMGAPLRLAAEKGGALLPLRAGMPVFFTGKGASLTARPAPVSLSVPAAARAGERVRVSCRLGGALAGAAAALEAEPGWAAAPAANAPQAGAAWTLAVPKDAHPGRHAVTVLLRRGAQEVRLGADVEVVPALLEV